MAAILELAAILVGSIGGAAQTAFAETAGETVETTAGSTDRAETTGTGEVGETGGRDGKRK